MMYFILLSWERLNTVRLLQKMENKTSQNTFLITLMFFNLHDVAVEVYWPITGLYILALWNASGCCAGDRSLIPSWAMTFPAIDWSFLLQYITSKWNIGMSYMITTRRKEVTNFTAEQMYFEIYYFPSKLWTVYNITLFIH